MTGFGLGLREPHYGAFRTGTVDADFIEVISENFMVPGGQALDTLRAVREFYPVALHGVSLSVGSASGLDGDYLRRLRALVDAIDPLFVSDHLCWTRMPGFSSHDLLPLPYTGEVLDLVARHVGAVQDALGRQILLENPSTYLSFPEAEMSEWAFFDSLCDRTGCGLLLDVNNVYVSARNLGLDPAACLAEAPFRHVRQIHLAGHSQNAHMLVDTHDQPVCDPVWDLFDIAIRRAPDVAVMIERDGNIPALENLLAELNIARSRAARVAAEVGVGAGAA